VGFPPTSGFGGWGEKTHVKLTSPLNTLSIQMLGLHTRAPPKTAGAHRKTQQTKSKQKANKTRSRGHLGCGVIYSLYQPAHRGSTQHILASISCRRQLVCI
jgi:hypothetical protein